MVTLLQALLLAFLSVMTWLVVGVLRGHWWVAGAIGIALLALLWFAYLVWQARHPEWWAPWDDGVPQVSRMVNVFVPVLMIFVIAVFVLTLAQGVRR